MTAIRAATAALTLLCATVAHTSRVTAQSAGVEAAISEASLVWRLNPEQLRCLARREATFNPNAVSPGGHVGIAQFLWSTWNAGKREARNPADPSWPLLPPDATPFNPREALLLAGWFIATGAHGGARNWSTLPWCPR